MARTKKAAPKKGRGAPGKPKSAAHKAAISKALKAFHSRGGKKRKSLKRRRAKVTGSARSKHVLKNLTKQRRAEHAARPKRGRRKTTRAKASARSRYYKNRATSKPSRVRRSA